MQNDQQPKEDLHEIWMKNTSCLYDRLIVHQTKWPSLTFQWLPSVSPNSSEFLYATHTSGRRPIEHLYIGKVEVQQTQLGMKPAQVSRVKTWNYPKEINKARYCRNNPRFIGGRADNSPVIVLDREKEEPVTLKNSLSAGFALDWNQGLLTADHDGNILLYNSADAEPEIMKYEVGVEDARFLNECTFLTASDDGCLCIWDGRVKQPQHRVQACQGELYACCSNPYNSSLIITGGEDGNVRSWDLRNLSQKLYSFEGHNGPVLSLSWCSSTPTIFASGSQDKSVKIWDLLRVGFEVPRDHNFPDELLKFTHEGHRGDVTDLDWNSQMLGSTEQLGNTIQLYEIMHEIHKLDNSEEFIYLMQQCLS